MRQRHGWESINKLLRDFCLSDVSVRVGLVASKQAALNQAKLHFQTGMRSLYQSFVKIVNAPSRVNLLGKMAAKDMLDLLFCVCIDLNREGTAQQWTRVPKGTTYKAASLVEGFLPAKSASISEAPQGLQGF